MAVSALSDALTDIESAVGGIFGATQGGVDHLFNGLGQLSFALTILMWFADGRPAAHGPFIKMILKVMAIGWLIDVFPTLSNSIITGMLDLSGEIGSAGFSLRDPGAVGTYGLEMAGPILERAKELGGFPDFFFALPVIFLYILAYLGCILAFFVIGIQLFMTWLEWRFLSVAAFFCLPFAILAPTSFIAERAIGYVASTGIKVFAIGLVVGVSTIAMAHVNEEAMSLSLALGAVVLSAAICVMSLKIPSAAAGLVNGGPVTSAMDAFVGMAFAAKAGALAVKASGGAVGMGMIGAGKVMQGWGGGGAAGAGGAAGTSLGMPPGGPGGLSGGGGSSAGGTAAGSAGAGSAGLAGGRSYPGRAAALGGSLVSAGARVAQASGWHGAGGAGAAAAGGAGGGQNSSWFQGPTERQQYAADRAGVDLSGLNRAQASVALQNAGYGRNLAEGSASGEAAIRGNNPMSQSSASASSPTPGQGAAVTASAASPMPQQTAASAPASAPASGSSPAPRYQANRPEPGQGAASGVTRQTHGGIGTSPAAGGAPSPASSPASSSSSGSSSGQRSDWTKYKGFDAQGEAWIEQRLAAIRAAKSS